ncbi:MAG: DUF6361 family protein [Myxococcaceae bacterium]
MPPSSITWLDFRRDDLKRARELIDSFRVEGVLDELGFLGLQVAFADVFYPATSTLMQSARYLYFVAAIYRGLEQEQVSSGAVEAASRKRQDQLREVLVETEDKRVIGREAKEQVKQLPSNIYWSALRQLGLFRGALSEAAYHARFDELHADGKAIRDDDKTPQAHGNAGYWDPELPSPRFLDTDSRFRAKTAFKLTCTEATDLRARYKRAFPDSLLTYLVKIKRHELPVPWACTDPPANLRPYLQAAKAVSLFARGVNLQYARLVSLEREKKSLPTEELQIPEKFEGWWRDAASILRGWAPADLLKLALITPTVRSGSGGDIPFIEGWLERLRTAKTAAALLFDDKACEIVRRRELATKPGKARLKHPKHLELWKVTGLGDASYGLHYRHQIGTRVVREILEGLGSAE